MNHLRYLVLAVTFAALAACQPKTSASGDTSAPVATVNGTPISRDFYDFYIKGITGGKTPADLSAQQRAAALDNLIRGQLVGAEAVKQGLDKSGDTAFMLELSRLQVLQQSAMERYLKDRKATDQEVRAEYDSELAQLPRTEYHARHILLDNEGAALQVIARLDKGEKFDELARLASKDPSKANGGDLGWFTLERMVPEFSAALTTLKSGEYTHKPVQTQYGYHVIQLLDTREVAPPAFDQVRGRIEQVVQAKKFRSYGDELMKNAKVEKFLDQPAAAAAPGAAATPAAPATPAAAAPAASPAAPPKN